MAKVMQQNPDGSWTEAQPIGWLEEHGRLARVIFAVIGVSHCGRKGWRK